MESSRRISLERALLTALGDEGGRAGIEGLLALMEGRSVDITEKILAESDPVEVGRMQGAVAELRRWINFPSELALRMEVMGEKVKGVGS